jgi:hypothetical protein
MICPPLPKARIVQDWVERHRFVPSLLLHLVGIPLSVLGILLIPVYLPLASWRIFLLSLGFFVGGYLFQFLGHLLEWTEPGEITALRTWWRSRRTPVRPS